MVNELVEWMGWLLDEDLVVVVENGNGVSFNVGEGIFFLLLQGFFLLRDGLEGMGNFKAFSLVVGKWLFCCCLNVRMVVCRIGTMMDEHTTRHCRIDDGMCRSIFLIGLRLQQ